MGNERIEVKMKEMGVIDLVWSWFVVKISGTAKNTRAKWTNNTQ
jgi:hypothetical protein